VTYGIGMDVDLLAFGGGQLGAHALHPTIGDD